MKSGLVSVSFRQKTPLEICALCRKANLSAVEWGGDVHCPPEADAAAIRAMTLDHGLEVSSYGSYYRVGQSLDAFKANLETAVKMCIRDRFFTLLLIEQEIMIEEYQGEYLSLIHI